MTSGFYKNHNGMLLYGPNFVLNKDYELKRENYNNYEYPVDGWYWFSSEEEAIEYFGISNKNENTSIDELN